MPRTTTSDRTKISERLLGKADEFPAYFELYESLVAHGSAHIIQIDQPRESDSASHDDILWIVELLKGNPRVTWAELNSQVHEQNLSSITTSGINKAVNIAVQAMIMVDCAARDRHSTTYEVDSYRPISWEPSEPFLDFVQRAFPRDSEGDRRRIKQALRNRYILKAWKLKKRLGVTFRMTDNLMEHLLYDSHNQVLYLFHQTAFLKAHLKRSSAHLAMECSLEESLKLGTVPPQLLVETLHSLQAVLFPILDDKSADILVRLTKKMGFDDDCNQYDGYMRFKEPPEDFTYHYWGGRLARLEELVIRREPRNKLERWFRWYTTDVNALAIALLALAISIVVGLIGIVISSIQLWIAWEAWRYPVAPPV
ncbi:hypothetical protein AOQ84DRAFT_419352 [Glonium stellatum]|uniref:Uncharacterized protein n=1 Tax=Glonium stellatum TaxID=574774 RepID=A0A8E2F8I9_9PEZI|nr:hypothetical protein AOQ84DRAFT_419352 [Glonium stellatum]